MTSERQTDGTTRKNKKSEKKERIAKETNTLVVEILTTDLGTKVDFQCASSVVDDGGQFPLSPLDVQLAQNSVHEAL